jgi:glycosyltransferase involved in cell wall biosynthesis
MPLRLGVFSGDIYWRSGDVVSTQVAFVRFVTGLTSRVDDLVIFGRLAAEPMLAANRLPSNVRFVALPHYRRLTHVRDVLRARRGSKLAFEAELRSLDAVWVFGPHPLAFDLIRRARRSDVAVFLGVRQDFARYARHRLTGVARLWGIPAAYLLDYAFAWKARRTPTVLVGEGARRYRRGRDFLVTGFSLVQPEEVVPLQEALTKSWEDELRILTVGRIDREKNPLLLPAVLASLVRRESRWRLVVAGEGPLLPDLERTAVRMAVRGALELRGYVPHGPALSELYRSSHVFLHVSRTEGLPQVLFEAAAAGLPIVATDVGGVGAAVAKSGWALLVLPNDAEGVARALELLRTHVALRRRLITRALEHARTETMDNQLDQLVSFFQAHLRG